MSRNICASEYTILELLSSANLMKAYILISNEMSDVIAFVSPLPETQIYVCISALQDGVTGSAKSVIV